MVMMDQLGYILVWTGRKRVYTYLVLKKDLTYNQIGGWDTCPNVYKNKNNVE
jgi:hypothetical protein